MDDKIYEGLSVYFEHLQNFGYMKQSNVNRFLLYIWIAELIEEYCDIMSQEDSRQLENVLQCLEQKLCMIPKAIYYNWKVSINGDSPKEITFS